MVDQFFGGRLRLSGDNLEEIRGGWTSDNSGGESEEGSFIRMDGLLIIMRHPAERI